MVLEARDGSEALRILASARPDLLITDVGPLNNMNGRQVAEAARECIPRLPLLFITGYVGTALSRLSPSCPARLLRWLGGGRGFQLDSQV